MSRFNSTPPTFSKETSTVSAVKTPDLMLLAIVVASPLEPK